MTDYFCHTGKFALSIAEYIAFILFCMFPFCLHNNICTVIMKVDCSAITKKIALGIISILILINIKVLEG